ncbi:MAG: hypothetical protein P4K94_07655, partial [Terracidiphilus sp.]|nr:hypothetical protein [Terracidiphilus sp.]
MRWQLIAISSDRHPFEVRIAVLLMAPRACCQGKARAEFADVSVTVNSAGRGRPLCIGLSTGTPN